MRCICTAPDRDTLEHWNGLGQLGRLDQPCLAYYYIRSQRPRASAAIPGEWKQAPKVSVHWGQESLQQSSTKYVLLRVSANATLMSAGDAIDLHVLRTNLPHWPYEDDCYPLPVAKLGITCTMGSTDLPGHPS